MPAIILRATQDLSGYPVEPLESATPKTSSDKAMTVLMNLSAPTIIERIQETSAPENADKWQPIQRHH